MRTPLSIVCALFVACVLNGCAGAPGDGGRVSVPGGGYVAAFDAARDALRDAGYALERVDAREGVITTKPRHEPAFVAGAGGADSLWNAQRSVARVEFHATEGAGARVDDLRDYGGALEARVEVLVERLQRPGRKIESMSIRRSSVWREPGWEERGLQPSFGVPVGVDEAAAGRLAARIAGDGREIMGPSPR